MIPSKAHTFLDVILEIDLPKMLAWRNHPSIWSWCRQQSLITPGQHQAWYKSLDTRDDVKMFAIRNKNSELVGICGLTDIDHVNQRAEFSCYIGPEYQLRGYASAALFDLFTHGFSALNLHSIWGETFEGNPAIGCFERLGMKCEGTRRDFYYKNGNFIGAKLYSITRREWLG